MPPRTRSTWEPFTDPISGQRMALAIHGDRATYWDRRSGVEHDGCDRLADVSPQLDAFSCPECGRKGRLSGAWAMDVLHAHNNGHAPDDETDLIWEATVHGELDDQPDEAPWGPNV